MKNLKEGGDVQKAFKEPPATVLKYLKAGESEFVKLKWALKTFESDKYLAKQSSDELEDFLVGVIRFISQNSQYKHKSLLKEVLLKVIEEKKESINFLFRSSFLKNFCCRLLRRMMKRKAIKQNVDVLHHQTIQRCFLKKQTLNLKLD